MKKNILFVGLIDLIIAVCFNAIFFINIKNPITQIWISYGFINFAFLMMILSPLVTKNSKSTYLFSVVNTSVSTVYYIATIVFGLVCIFSRKLSVNLTLTIFIILTAIYLIIFLSMLIIERRTDGKN